ncbi:hypothetical protein K2O51_33955 (plasmid) [Cupriavidus pinatubonensis]|uniref:LysR substrate-binding domain-containing protein n=1 Tax=Cupriavidus pinatubonensis TaxID=248026 RepID=UPI001C73C776|nr:hypothetical protein K2O51_33955 [Cupriavidus pinatubonensis]
MHNRSRVRRAELDGLADVGLFWAETPHAGVVTAPYRSERLVMVVPAGHALADKPGVYFAETLDFAYVAFHECSMIHRLSVQTAESLQRTIQTRLQVTQF